jgi:hypothetical protein
MVRLDVQKIVVLELKIAHTRIQHVEEKDYYTTNHVLHDIYTELRTYGDSSTLITRFTYSHFCNNSTYTLHNLQFSVL